MEGMPGGVEELSVMRTLMDDEDHCEFCHCHAAYHAPHIERVGGEPVLISLACMNCAIERNVSISSCHLSPQNVIDATPAAKLQERKTLGPEDMSTLVGATRMVAALTRRHYDPPR